MFSIKTTLNPKLTELTVSTFVPKIVQKIFKTIVEAIAWIIEKKKKRRKEKKREKNNTLVVTKFILGILRMIKHYV